MLTPSLTGDVTLLTTVVSAGMIFIVTATTSSLSIVVVVVVSKLIKDGDGDGDGDVDSEMARSVGDDPVAFCTFSTSGPSFST